MQGRLLMSCKAVSGVTRYWRGSVSILLLVTSPKNLLS